MATNIPPILNTESPLVAPSSAYVKCDFCSCTLTKSGEVFRMSDQAREFRDQREKFEKQIAEKQSELDAVKAENVTLTRRIEELSGTGVNAAPQSTRKNGVGVF